MWWLGCIFSFLGTVCANFGVNCQKLSAIRQCKVKIEERISYFRRPLWQVGIILIIMGSLGDFAGLAFAAQSLVAPIRAFTLVSNIFFAGAFLGEKIGRSDWIGCGAIVSGSILAVAFGAQSSESPTLTDLKTNFTAIPFIVYALLTFGFLVFSFLKVRKMDETRLHLEFAIQTLHTDSSLIVEVGETPREKYEKLKEAYEPYVKLHPFLCCALSGTLGGQSLTFAKCVAVLIRITFQGSNPFLDYFLYVSLVSMAFFIIGQIHFLNAALCISDSLFVVPIFQVFFVTFSTLGGLFYYQEYRTLGVGWEIALFASGVFMIIGGVYILSMRDLHNLEYGLIKEEEATCSLDKFEVKNDNASPMKYGFTKDGTLLPPISNSSEIEMTKVLPQETLWATSSGESMVPVTLHHPIAVGSLLGSSSKRFGSMVLVNGKNPDNYSRNFDDLGPISPAPFSREFSTLADIVVQAGTRSVRSMSRGILGTTKEQSPKDLPRASVSRQHSSSKLRTGHNRTLSRLEWSVSRSPSMDEEATSEMLQRDGLHPLQVGVSVTSPPTPQGQGLPKVASHSDRSLQSTLSPKLAERRRSSRSRSTSPTHSVDTTTAPLSNSFHDESLV